MLEGIRKLHYRRMLDVVAGSIVNKTRVKTQAEFTKLSKILSTSRKDLNDQIRAASPSIHIIDPLVVATEYINYISEHMGLLAYTSEPKFSKIFTDTARQELASIIKSTLEKSFDKVDIHLLTKELSDEYQNSLDKLNSLKDTSRKYIEYQKISARLGGYTRKYLNGIGVAILKNPEKFIDGLGDRVAFVSPTFNLMVSKTNSILDRAVASREFRKTYGNFRWLGKEPNVGNIVHAGHTGIYTNTGSLLGINMPSANISGLVSGKMAEIEQAVGNIPIHIDYGIKLKPEFTQFAGMFLDLQFNFSVSMSEVINSRILGVEEQKVIRDTVGNITSEALKQAITKQLPPEVLMELGLIASGSPTISEYLLESIKASIEGKKLQKLSHTREAKESKRITTTTKSSVKNTDSSTKVKAPKQKIPSIKSTSLVNLDSLLAYINANLHEQLRKNMRSPALNYQTGRFASSAKVEKMSESRNGMITAFYSYMKNPYQTFEPGFKQGSEKRNPKTLISKSIREIAAQQVGNRLRAVRV